MEEVVRLIVEFAQPEVTQRLQKQLDDVTAENKQLTARVESLHKTVYELMAREADRNRGKR